jgi:hypothetical protein
MTVEEGRQVIDQMNADGQVKGKSLKNGGYGMSA